jgi:DNA repair exonuclease SbcCD nuclease subunit
MWPTPRAEATLDAFAAEMEGVRPDYIIHAGDVFNLKRPQSDAVEYATKWLTRLAAACKELILIPGGHDQDVPAGTTAVDFADDLAPNITVIYEPINWWGLFMMPYQRKLTPEQVDMIAASQICVIHQGIDKVPLDNGKRLYGNVSDAVPYSAFANVKLAVVGHMHTPWADGKNVCVLGSPYQTLYSHAICDRHYLMFDLENPASARLCDFPGVFFLKKLVLTVPAEVTRKELSKMLPAWEGNTYVDVTIGVEGPLSQPVANDIRQAVKSVYGDWADVVTVVSVLSTAERILKQEILDIMSIQDPASKTPSDWLEIWMERKGGAYFDANPELTKYMHQELEDILKNVDETKKRSA